MHIFRLTAPLVGVRSVSLWWQTYHFFVRFRCLNLLFLGCLLAAYCLLTADAVVYHPLLHNDMVIFLVVTYSLCFLDII